MEKMVKLLAMVILVILLICPLVYAGGESSSEEAGKGTLALSELFIISRQVKPPQEGAIATQALPIGFRTAMSGRYLTSKGRKGPISENFSLFVSSVDFNREGSWHYVKGWIGIEEEYGWTTWVGNWGASFQFGQNRVWMSLGYYDVNDIQYLDADLYFIQWNLKGVFKGSIKDYDSGEEISICRGDIDIALPAPQY